MGEASSVLRHVELQSDLAVHEYLLVYDKSRQPKGKKMDYIEAIAPLLKLEWINKGRRVRMVPNPILVDQIDSYYILKPVSFFKPVIDKDIVKVRFLEYLGYHAFKKQKDNAKGKQTTNELRVETIAFWLSLDSLVTS